MGQLRLRANALDLSTVKALNMLSVCWGVVERDVQMTSKMTQHVEQSDDFTKAHVQSWLIDLSIRWALRVRGLNMLSVAVQKCTRLCWATHGWPWNKGNVDPCWAKSLTSFKFDSTRLNIAQNLSTGCSNAVNLLSSTCWELVQWTNPVHLHAA